MKLWIQSATPAPVGNGMTAVPLKRNENGGVGLNFSKEAPGPFTIVSMPEAVRLCLRV